MHMCWISFIGKGPTICQNQISQLIISQIISFMFEFQSVYNIKNQEKACYDILLYTSCLILAETQKLICNNFYDILV